MLHFDKKLYFYLSPPAGARREPPRKNKRQLRETLANPEVTERSLGVHPGSLSSLPCPEAICESAFDTRDDKLCCIRQIAEVTKTSVEQVADLMDVCEKSLYPSRYDRDDTETWRDTGCNAKMIFEYARQTGRGACVLHGDKSIETLPGKNALCFSIQANHAYFYIDARVRRQLMSRKNAEYHRDPESNR